jgi:hypothetical protein
MKTEPKPSFFFEDFFDNFFAFTNGIYNGTQLTFNQW